MESLRRIKMKKEWNNPQLTNLSAQCTKESYQGTWICYTCAPQLIFHTKEQAWSHMQAMPFHEVHEIERVS